MTVAEVLTATLRARARGMADAAESVPADCTRAGTNVRESLLMAARALTAEAGEVERTYPTPAEKRQRLQELTRAIAE